MPMTKKTAGPKPFYLCTVWKAWLTGHRWMEWIVHALVPRLYRRGLLTAEDYNALTFGTREDLKEFGRHIIHAAEHGALGEATWIGAFGFVVAESRMESLHMDKGELADGLLASAWRDWRYREGDKKSPTGGGD